MISWVIIAMSCDTAEERRSSPRLGVGDSGEATDSGHSIEDADEDGFASDLDCDDADGSVFPGADEVCGDGVDQDCDGSEVGCTGTIRADQGAGWVHASESTGVSQLGRSAVTVQGWTTDSTPLVLTGALGSWVADGSWPEAEGLPNGALFALDPLIFRSSRGEPVSSKAQFRVDSREIGAGLGTSMAAADFDGDGIDDLVVAAPGGFYSASPDTGSIWVYPGPIDSGGWHDALGGSQISRTDQAVLGVNQVLTARPGGPQDADGDGIPDFIAVSEAGCQVGEPQGGWVVSGARPLTGELSTIAVFLSADAACEGDNGPGSAMADFDGDGVLDFALGQELSDGASAGHPEPGIGLVALFSGPLDSDRIASDADWRAVGVHGGSDFGQSLSAGDLDGDGTDELAILARFEEASAVSLGRVWVVAPNGEASDLSVDEVATTSIAYGGSGKLASSSHVAVIGDMDAQGGNDLAISRIASSEDTSGEVLVFRSPIRGALAATDATLTIEGTAGSALGLFNSGHNLIFDAGDLNGDGFDELMICGPDDAARGSGALYQFYGGAWPD